MLPEGRKVLTTKWLPLPPRRPRLLRAPLTRQPVPGPASLYSLGCGLRSLSTPPHAPPPSTASAAGSAHSAPRPASLCGLG
eukprot:313898-Prorocentrum_minimum.AAC.1